MREVLGNALEVFSWHSGWIIWNLFLAFIPLALSFWLYRRKTKVRSLLWWVAFVVFLAFLPNAPYLLTDVIHLIRATRMGYSVWIIVLIFIPLHLFAILAGFQAYVISVMNQSSYLKRIGAGKFIVWSELITHALCAIGVYMGRFLRFNSWDLATDPGNVLLVTLDDVTAKKPLLVIFISFIVLTVLYWLTKQVNLGLLLRFREMRAKGEWFE
ncbi:MAG: DUF1361 domain-containing protein [Leptolyngbyaceae cyanobacterium]|uniref:DUF1361 domain-containing protein n=1 Tax=Leptodesmis sichuanensis TaxID=2906798 RepID=UPI001F1D264F|nr:DUF1361 domain-containing protein [Leptodesmis sichuanensis]UIE40270.1 DUF1361 domain-containing protein [Leptodesmis sichuanensis A121]